MTQTAYHPANRLGLNYRKEAAEFSHLTTPIIDAHTHINGDQSAILFKEVADLFGISQIYSMTHLENVDRVRSIFGEHLKLIAVPNFAAEDKQTVFTTDWLQRIDQFADLGCRICKFWMAPRARDYADELGDPTIFTFDGIWMKRAVKRAADRGMMFMTHIADPDTWFQTTYSDTHRYGTKEQQYEPFERLVDEYAPIPWLVAHMGGYPENLTFLDGLLERHPNIYLDTSATKWMVRELSKHTKEDLIAFLTKWKGRILFGSDIVVTDDHFTVEETGSGIRSTIAQLAGTKAQAFDLYASRYWALRTMWETNWEGQSPIADPDLMMVNPTQYDETSAPVLIGKELPQVLLDSLYHQAATNLLQGWEDNAI